jgi:hypothetical protein
VPIGCSYVAPMMCDDIHMSVENQEILPEMLAPTFLTFVYDFYLQISAMYSILQPPVTVIYLYLKMINSRSAFSFYLFFCCAATHRVPRPHHSRGFYTTHSDAPQSVGLLWTSDQLDTETSIWIIQHSKVTDIHVFRGI